MSLQSGNPINDLWLRFDVSLINVSIALNFIQPNDIVVSGDSSELNIGLLAYHPYWPQYR
jgi:hypothetical protein